MKILIRVVQFILTVVFTYTIASSLNLSFTFFIDWAVVAVVVYLALSFAADKLIQHISPTTTSSPQKFFSKRRVITIIAVVVAVPVLLYALGTILFLFFLPALTNGQI